MLTTILKQIGRYRTATWLTPAMTSMEVVMDVLIPYVTARLIDEGINAGNLEKVYLNGALMVGMAGLSLLFGILAGRFAAEASAGFAANLRDAMFRNIQRFSFSDIDKYSTSGLVTRMTTDVSNLQGAFQMLLRVTVRSPFRLVLSIVMCLLIDARLSLIFVFALVILASAMGYIISHVAKTFSKVFQQYDALNARVHDNVSAIRVVKAFVREDYERKRFDKAAEGLYRLFVRAETLMAFNHPVMNLVVYGCIISLSWFGAHYIVARTLTTGELTSLFTYVMSILMSLMMLSMVFVQLTMSAASASRIAEVIEEEPDIVNPKHPVMEVKNGQVEFNHVRFAYKGGSGEYALNNVQLSIKSGETVGVIGGTGSGKSTLVNLISRLYDVSKGTVYVGGVDVRNYDLETLRNAVAVVLQQNTLFSGTVRDNLLWGNPQATDEQCRQACRDAQADEFISRMPEEYDTWIEQGGMNLSGGQRQRLCIARALMKNPKVLVLDDSTSACDTATDARIREAFSRALPGTTKIIISGRILSVKDCDRIIVMDGGKVVGYDTHADLLRTNRIYQEIYAIQHEGGGDFDQPRTGLTGKEARRKK